MKSMNLGTWMAVGSGIGTAFFAATDEPSWIAAGIAIGVALHFANSKRSK
tara:strand:+ start:167 stop:316 length:150 start_codon:yes stop_codon:yes gene_type:complete